MLLGISWMDPTWLLDQFGSEFFWISLVIVFIECGLLFPFLPGDTLLFALGLFIATGKIDVFPGGELVELLIALVLMTAAAFAGNVVGYEIGRKLGEPLRNHDGRILKKKHLDKTHEFFERYGNRALILARFVPIVRTFVTLVAGVGRMDFRKFIIYTAIGGILWVTIVTVAGYYLGNVPFIKNNIEAVLVLIVFVSLIPMLVEYLLHRRRAKKAAAAA
jgi:membrane-associated protein